MHNKACIKPLRERLITPWRAISVTNFRGVGLSAGTHDRGHGEQDDVRAAINYMAAEFPDVPLLIAGFSFGCWVGLRVGSEDSRVKELVGVGPPVGKFKFLVSR